MPDALVGALCIGILQPLYLFAITRLRAIAEHSWSTWRPSRSFFGPFREREPVLFMIFGALYKSISLSILRISWRNLGKRSAMRPSWRATSLRRAIEPLHVIQGAEARRPPAISMA